MKPSIKISRALLFLVTILILIQIASAANDPGHDTLYIEEEGDSELNGSFNVTGNLSAEDIIFSGSQLDVRGDGVQVSGSKNQIIGTGGALSIQSLGPIYINTFQGTSSQIYLGDGTDKVGLNISGALYVRGSTATVGGTNICLENGTGCPSELGGANITGSGSANHIAYWTGSDTISYDNNQLYWDASSNELGIGLNNPGYALDVNGTSGFRDTLKMLNDKPIYLGGYAGGLQEATGHAHELIGHNVYYNGSSYVYKATHASFGARAIIMAYTDSSPNGMPGQGIHFFEKSGAATANTNVSFDDPQLSILNVSVVFDDAVNVGIGVANPGEKLEVAGDINVTSGYDICIEGGNCLSSMAAGDGNITGSGNAGYLAKFTAAGVIANSIVSESGNLLTINGNISMPSHFYIGGSATSTGTNSIAVGGNSQATQNYALALGNAAWATGINTVAIGRNSLAAANYSTAVGQNSNASGRWSSAITAHAETRGDFGIALGYEAVTGLSDQAIAIGGYSDATATEATALGSNSQATANYVTALGARANATTQYATAIGYSADAQGEYAIAIGGNSQSIDTDTIAIGQNTDATQDQAIAIGTSAQATGQEVVAIGYRANATTQYAIALGYQADALNDSSIGIGYSSDATGEYSIAIGRTADATNGSTIAIGDSANASAQHGVAIGRLTDATGYVGTALGYGAQATGDSTVGLGRNAIASGTYAVSLGSYTEAISTSGLAIGYRTNTTADYGIALGYYSDVTADNAVAMGRSAQATETEAISIGRDAQAINTSAIAIGYDSLATGESSVAIGRIANATDRFGIAIGYFAGARGADTIGIGRAANATNQYATAIGYQAQGTGNEAVAIGKDAKATNTSATAIGNDADAQAAYSIAIGQISEASGSTTTAIGYEATAANLSGLTIGHKANTTGYRAIAIGGYSDAHKHSAIAIGYDANATANFGIALGPYAGARDVFSIAIGYFANATQNEAIAIGRDSDATNNYAVAIGYGAQATAIDSIAIGRSITNNVINSTLFGGHVRVNGDINTTAGDVCIVGGNCLSSMTAGDGNITGNGVANRVAFYTGAGTISYDNNLTWNNTNKRLGIGTSSPDTDLEIAASPGSDVYLRLTAVTNMDSAFQLYGDRDWIIQNDGDGSIGDADSLQIYDITASTSRIAIDATGDVGIGDATPSAKLEINGTGVLLNISNGTDSILWVNESNIGIGTTNPRGKLHLYSNGTDSELRVTAGSGTVDPYILFSDGVTDVTNDWAVGMDDSDSQAFIISNDQSMGTDVKLKIQADGNVGIGTTSPTAKLEINGTGVLLNISNGTDPILFVNESHVGIGTSTPENPFHVASTDIFMATFEQINPGSNMVVTLKAPYGNNTNLEFNEGTNRSAAIRWDGKNDRMEFRINDSAKVVIDNISGNVGIGTTSPNTTLHVDGDINATGDVCEETSGNCLSNVGSGDGNITGAGTSGAIAKFTGDATIANSIVSESGNTLSIAGNISMPTKFYIGNSATATGAYATVIGSGAQGTDDNTAAFGRNARALENSATAIGYQANATGNYSTAIGENTDAREYATAIGGSAQATNDYTLAMGNSASATGTSSTALGVGTQSSGTYAIAIGYEANASQNYALALGDNALANNYRSIAIGREANATGAATIAIGYDSDAIANGAMAIGEHSNATATYAISIGYDAVNAYQDSVAIGRESEATAQNQLMIGSSTYNLNTRIYGDINITGQNISTVDCIHFDSGGKICSGS